MASKQSFIEPLEVRETRDEIRLVLNHRGIGDLVVAAYSIAGLKHDFPQKRVVFDVLKGREQWAELFQDADAVETHERPPDSVIDRFAKSIHRFQGRFYLNENWNRHQQYAKKCRTTARKPTFKTPVPYDWSKHGLSVPPVIIVPESTQSVRMWSRSPDDTDSNWVELAQMLESEGVPVVALTGREFYRSVKADGPEDMLSILNSTPLIISVDTGPAHLAGMLGKYTLVMNGVENGPGIFNQYERVRCIQGKRINGKLCSPCNRHPEFGYKTICYEWCEALSRVSVKEVYDEALSILIGVKSWA